MPCKWYEKKMLYSIFWQNLPSYTKCWLEIFTERKKPIKIHYFSVEFPTNLCYFLNISSYFPMILPLDSCMKGNSTSQKIKKFSQTTFDKNTNIHTTLSLSLHHHHQRHHISLCVWCLLTWDEQNDGEMDRRMANCRWDEWQQESHTSQKWRP